MITSKQRSLIGLGALLGLIATQAACGSSDSTPDSRPVTETGGSTASLGGSTSSGGSSAANGGSVAANGGSVASSGGSTSVGGSVGSNGGSVAANGGNPGANGGSANGGGGNGGRSGGNGGRSGGNGGNTGSSGSGGNAGTGTATFAAVSDFLNFTCTGCHGGPPHVDLTPANVYNSLTKPLATSDSFCKGTTLVTPGMASASFLVKVLSGAQTCPTGGGNIMRMPLNGSAISAANLKMITDWINAGAKMQ